MVDQVQQFYQPQEITNTSLEDLAATVKRELIDVSNAFTIMRQVTYHQPQSDLPVSPIDGLLAYFNAGVAGASAGFYGYEDGAWVKLAPEPAYGGMRFTTGTTTPVAGAIGTAPQKITLYDEEMPRFGDPENVSFDDATDEVVIAADQGGTYEATVYLNFEGEQGELYTISLYLDGAPIGDDIHARVSQADNVEELQLTTIGRINGEGRWSVWVNADKASTTFNVFGTSLYFARVSARQPDQVAPAGFAF